MKQLLVMWVLLALTTPLPAQWISLPTPGIPRTADGAPDLSGPAPRTADGHPDFTGLWRTGRTGGNSYGLRRILQHPTMIAVLYNDGSYREIFMDGRELEENPLPTWMGYSVGRWEGDTLVIDTVGFNERFWFARKPTGIVHTDALHLVERISRPDYETLRYEVTIDDPKAYTRPWTASWELPWSESEMVEYLCAENPRGYSHIVGPR